MCESRRERQGEWKSERQPVCVYSYFLGDEKRRAFSQSAGDVKAYNLFCTHIVTRWPSHTHIIYIESTSLSHLFTQRWQMGRKGFSTDTFRFIQNLSCQLASTEDVLVEQSTHTQREKREKITVIRLMPGREKEEWHVKPSRLSSIVIKKRETCLAPISSIQPPCLSLSCDTHLTFHV